MEYTHICDLTPTEFEKYCCDFLEGYAEKEHLQNFKIIHNTRLKASDGNYQIDVYAEFTAMGVNFKILCECKRYKNSVNRDKVAILHQKLQSVGAHKGILISTSDFQSGAIEYGKKHGIALIKAEDYHFEYLSHASGLPQNDDDNPFLYAEKHMPPYVAFDCTADTDEPLKIYPTQGMIKELLIKQIQKIKEVMGIDIPFDFSEI
ncbi:MAG: restriction endonuclease [Clostridia bacterium]|nr:restriction endonuclease [Clostridia bacterium]